MKCLKWQKVTLQLTWMNFLQNCEVCFNQERLPITYQNFRHKSLVRPKSKSPNWQESQPISYKTKFSQRDNIYLLDLKYNITYQNIQGETKVRPIFIPWNAKNAKKLTWVTFLQNHEVCFNQKSWPITYHNFCHKRLVRPKSKLPWISTHKLQGHFLQRNKMHIADHKKENLSKYLGEN